MMYDFDVSDLFCPVVDRYNKGLKEFIEEVKKRISFEETDASKTYGDFETIAYNEANGLIEEVVLRRKTEKQEVSIKIISNQKLNGRFLFRCFYNGRETDYYKHDYMDATTFLTTFRSNFKQFFTLDN